MIKKWENIVRLIENHGSWNQLAKFIKKKLHNMHILFTHGELINIE